MNLLDLKSQERKGERGGGGGGWGGGGGGERGFNANQF